MNKQTSELVAFCYRSILYFFWGDFYMRSVFSDLFSLLKQRLSPVFMSSMALGTLALSMSMVHAPIAHAALGTICPADRMNSNGKICTANDVELAAAVVGNAGVGATCTPGEVVLVEIDGTLTVRTERSDIGVWIATDGRPIKPRSGLHNTPDEGGAQTCEVMPLTSPHGITPEAVNNPFLVYDFEPQGDCPD
ncbi:MAG TPA: hypothetical protein VIS57_05385, partial [Xanthomonadales bacterium]